MEIDTWVLNELTGLRIASYRDILPRVSAGMSRLRQVESHFVEAVAGSLTKRQAVGFGLLARTFQLAVSCLVNQLFQDYAGWNCSYRSLLETFFVIDWIRQDPQRSEAYFEDRAPGIGRIKNDCCGRHPEFATTYEDVSQVTHIGTRALYLPRKQGVGTPDRLPFTATDMNVAGSELDKMLQQFADLLDLLVCGLERLLVEDFDVTTQGAVLWEKGIPKRKFGCLGWEPRTTRPPEDTSSDSSPTI